MINEDISQGKERTKVPVVNELNDEQPTPFEVIIYNATPTWTYIYTFFLTNKEASTVLCSLPLPFLSK